MSQIDDFLGAGCFEEERLLSPKEIKAQFEKWKKDREGGVVTPQEVEDHPEEDTQPLTRAEMEKTIFENKCTSMLLQNKMKAGLFFSLPEVKLAIHRLQNFVGDSVGEILGDYVVDKKDLFA